MGVIAESLHLLYKLETEKDNGGKMLTEMAWAFKVLKPTPSDELPRTLLSLSKQF